MAMNTASAVLTPSPWVSRVFSANGVVQPIRIVPHGVADAFVPFAAEPPQSKFTFLHFSAVQVPARKGTMELLEAFGNVAERIDAYLDIRSAVPGALRAYVGTKPWKERVSITLDDPGPPAEMAKKLCSAHCVVAPSRAEGFGMICDEALACAVPVVATACTGHEGRLTETTPGLRVVPHGGMEPCGPVGKAPSISVHKLEDALVEMRFAYQDFSREARRNAVRFFYAHQWEAVLSSSPLLDTLIA
jgi:glycosyltransferase involved in cell wall biosynthesis